MRIVKILGLMLLVAAVIYFCGPTPAKPHYNTQLPTIPETVSSLEWYVQTQNQQHRIKPGNEAAIVWQNDSVPAPTDYVLLYLHGFSASQEEGNPVHRNIAKTLGCNLYLARLSEHGIDTTDALINMTAESLWNSAKEAYAIAKNLGKKVIVVGTSTGGSLALQLAASYPEIAAVVLYSPNIAIYNPNAWLLNNPWGLQIARKVQKSNFNTAGNGTDEYKKFWNHQYRLEATVQLEEYLETAMVKETFNKIKQPVLCLYYYKNEEEQDKVVKVSAMKTMFEQLGTETAKKEMIAVPNAGNHVLTSAIVSKDIVTPQQETLRFLRAKLGLQ